MSINRAQSEALASGFVDSLGSEEEKSFLQPKETLTELFLLAGEFVEDMQENLNTTKSNATGNLSSSIVLGEPKENGNVVSVEVYMNYYGLFVNSGVKGTRSGSSKAGYSFKNEFPSTGMVKAFQSYIKRAKNSSVNVKRAVARYDIKNKSIAEISHAYAAARSVKMFGIKATGFIDKAFKTTSDKVDDRLGKAFKIDIINSI